MGLAETVRILACTSGIRWLSPRPIKAPLVRRALLSRGAPHVRQGSRTASSGSSGETALALRRSIRGGIVTAGPAASGISSGAVTPGARRIGSLADPDGSGGDAARRRLNNELLYSSSPVRWKGLFDFGNG
jgi:hypothetical protein